MGGESVWWKYCVFFFCWLEVVGLNGFWSWWLWFFCFFLMFGGCLVVGFVCCWVIRFMWRFLSVCVVFCGVCMVVECYSWVEVVMEIGMGLMECVVVCCVFLEFKLSLLFVLVDGSYKNM